MFDYDLVIIGGTPAGRAAALSATYLQARVALVEPANDAQDSPLSGVRSPEGGQSYSQTLAELGRMVHQQHLLTESGLFGSQNPTAPALLEEAVGWANSVASNLEDIHSRALLASVGVDLIVGAGEFTVKPSLAFQVNGRELRSRTYLLATPSRPFIPDIQGLSSTGYLTVSTVRRLAKLEKLPARLVVIGADPGGVELAQGLARLGVQVTVVVKSTQILAKEDPEAAQLVQVAMEAEGIRILTQTEVTQARKIEDKTWIQAGNEAIEADQILLAAGQGPNFASLNLEVAGVKLNQQQLILNKKLQTTNPRIYACGDGGGGYPFVNLAYYEAKIALKNALFLPIFNVNYRGIPWAIFSDPQLARVGLTEVQARRNYGENIVISREYFKQVDKAQMQGEITGFCKLIGRRNGEILGATLVGPQAAELIHPIALAMRQGLKIQAIAELPHIWPSLSEMNQLTAATWQLKHFRSNTFLHNCLENLFHWRRYWSI